MQKEIQAEMKEISKVIRRKNILSEASKTIRKQNLLSETAKVIRRQMKIFP